MKITRDKESTLIRVEQDDGGFITSGSVEANLLFEILITIRDQTALLSGLIVTGLSQSNKFNPEVIQDVLEQIRKSCEEDRRRYNV